LDNFALPGDAGFPLNNLYAAPDSKVDGDFLRQWLLQARQETALRLVDRVYSVDGRPSKWWMAFTKRKFMNRSL
jgi:actin related protein 2/3 complex subunit 3